MAINWPGTGFNGRTVTVKNGALTALVTGNLADDIGSTDPGAAGWGFRGPLENSVYTLPKCPLHPVTSMSYDIGLDKTTLTLGETYAGATIGSSTVTITIAAPGVVTWTAHNLVAGQAVVFTSTGTLPTGIVSGTTYYVSSSSPTANSFRISTTQANALAGTNITTTGSQSGTHTGVTTPAIGDFSLPPFQGLSAAAAYQLSLFLDLPVHYTATLAAAKAAFTGVILPSGFSLGVAGRTAVNDGYQGNFVYDPTDTTSTFLNDAIGFVDAAAKRWKRVHEPDTYSLHWWPNILGNGVADDRAGIQAAINDVRTLGGGTLVFAGKTYVIGSVASSDTKPNGLLIPHLVNDVFILNKRLSLRGAGVRTKLMANVNDMILLRVADSYASIKDMGFDGNSKSNVWGLAIIPESMTQTTTLVNQNYCHISNLYLHNMTEGMVFQTGPIVTGAQSGCWNNNIYSITMVDCLRGIYFKNGTAGSSGANNNNFFGFRLGRGPNAKFNCGIYIEDGASGGGFIGGKIEGAVDAGPMATATGIYLIGTGANSALTQGNTFVNMQIESCTRDLHNDATTTTFLATGLVASKIFGTVYPTILQQGGLNSIDDSLISRVNGVPGRLATFKNTSGVGGNYNGFRFTANEKLDGTQGDTGKISVGIDVGGYDQTEFANTVGHFSIIYRPAGGSRVWAGGFGNGFMEIPSITAPSQIPGRTLVYVDSADGDLKCIFANGQVRTLAVN